MIPCALHPPKGHPVVIGKIAKPPLPIPGSLLLPLLARYRVNGWEVACLGHGGLLGYGRNPRTHSDTQVGQIADSIQTFGFNNPILVDTQAGIIAGHGRLLAARKLQLGEVPVIVLDHLTGSQKRAYILADNQLALNAGWDEELLQLELAAPQDEEFNLDLIGFETAELDGLLCQDTAIGLTEEDAVPEPRRQVGIPLQGS